MKLQDLDYDDLIRIGNRAVALYRRCSTCGGGATTGEPCKKCDGLGVEPSDKAKALLEGTPGLLVAGTVLLMRRELPGYLFGGDV